MPDVPNRPDEAVALLQALREDATMRKWFRWLEGVPENLRWSEISKFASHAASHGTSPALVETIKMLGNPDVFEAVRQTLREVETETRTASPNPRGLLGLLGLVALVALVFQLLPAGQSWVGVHTFQFPPGKDQKTATVPSVPAVEPTPASQHDRAVIAKISNRWNSIPPATSATTGSVVVAFTLHSDGRVSHVHVISNSVPPELAAQCVRAVEQSAPFPAFPAELRSQGETREGSTTFNY